MPETENEIEAALKELPAQFEDATNRARELTDAWVRYLVAINGGAIGVTFGLASAYSDGRVSSLGFGWPVLMFTVGLLCAGLAMFLEHNRQDARANTASNLMRQLDNGALTATQSRVEWAEFITNQGKSPWPWPQIAKWGKVGKWIAKWAWTPPRNAALASIFAFLVGTVVLASGL